MTPTKDQQLDALWKALHNQEYWVSCFYEDRLDDNPFTMYLNTNVEGRIGKHICTFCGPTRDDVIAQLITYQVADRIEGKE